MFGIGEKGVLVRVDQHDDILTIRVSRDEISVTSNTGASMSYEPNTDREHEVLIQFEMEG